MTRISVHEKAEYLADVVFAASDGVVTTFAVVAGSAGASLEKQVVLILGFANLFADGISMAAGSYLGTKSEIQYEKAKGKEADEGSPIKHALVTFISFGISGLVPLAPFVILIGNPFISSTLFVGIALLTVGFLKSIYTKTNIFRSGMETFLVGGFATFVAFGVGFLFRNYFL